jgi:hypothetical protein
MTVLGHTITWGTHIGSGRKSDAKGWYAQMKTRWGAHKTTQHEAGRTSFTVTATDAMEPAHARLVATAFGDIGV